MKTYFKIALIAVVMAISGYGVYAAQADNATTDVVSANENALIDGDGGSGGNGGSGTAKKCGGPKTNSECESRNTVECHDLTGC